MLGQDFSALSGPSQFRLFPVKKEANLDKTGTSLPKDIWNSISSLSWLAWRIASLLVLLPILAAVNGSSGDKSGKAERKSLRRREDRGLPEQEALRDLARTYLEVQGQIWPQLISGGYLDRPSAKAAERLADGFKTRFLAGTMEQFELPQISEASSLYGAAYLRYSCDNSNPRSLDQQLRNVLERAGRDQVFIPWEWVMADAAVTGTVANRRGYQMAKSLISTKIKGFSRLYIDELGRAARDSVESLRLGREIDREGFVLIGVTDGFDSSTQQSKMMLSIYAMLHEWFVDQLRAKVYRGMNDAFEQGKNIQPPAFGHKLIPLVDEAGDIVCDQDGKAVNTKVVDTAIAPLVVEAFNLLVEQKMSPEKIARRFNEKRAGGRQAWDRRQIVNLLKRESYVGVEFYRKTKRVVDSETGSVTIEKLPRDKWKRREKPSLRIVSDELWHAAQDRLRQCSEAFGKHKKRTKKRTEVYPSMLFRPVCGYCGNDLCLGRSGKYASLCCLNGRDGKRGCKLRSYKSLKIVEDSILNHLKEQIFTKEAIKSLVVNANRFLKSEAKRPREGTGAILKEISQLSSKRDRLAKKLEKLGDDGLEVVMKQIKRMSKELDQLQAKRKEVEARNVIPPAPMTEVDVDGMLTKLRKLLETDVASSAPILKELTGDIVIRQVREEGKRGATWIANFSVNAVPMIAQIAARTSCPTSGTWEYLHDRGWTTTKTTEMRIERIPEYEKLAPGMLELYKKSNSVQVVASAYGISRNRAKGILEFAKTGNRPQWKSGKKVGKGVRADY